MAIMINNDRITEAYTGGIVLNEVYCDNNQILNDLVGGVDPAEADDGIYILNANNGRLYNKEEWTEGKNDNVVGIALIDGKTRVCIALADISVLSRWGNQGMATIPYYTTTDINEAEQIYNGAEATIQWTNTFGTNTTYAAGRCRAYSFNGGRTGYLGSTGEWISVMNHILEINVFMEYVGGDTINITNHWTSIQYDIDNAWIANLNKSVIEKCPLAKYSKVRPFTKV